MKDITYIHLRTEIPLKTRYEIKPKHHVIQFPCFKTDMES